MSNLVLKIKTSLNDDIRLFKGRFNDLKDAFDKLVLFINKSYELDNTIKYFMQYRDDENDLVTIANELDLQDAIDQANEIKKSVKIFIKLRNKNKNNKPEPIKPKNNINNNNNNNNVDEKSNDIDDNDDNSSELTGVLCTDLCNNEKFKKEFILFLNTIILLYQSNGNGNNNDEKMDLTTCIITSLSEHSMVSEHKQIKALTSKMNMFIPQIELFISQILLRFDVKNVEIMVNKFVENKKKGINSYNMFQTMGFPFMIFSNMFNNCNFKPKSCPGKHGLHYFNTPTGSYICDGCNTKMNWNSPMYGCRTCDYDLCVLCYNGNHNFGTGFQGPFGTQFQQQFGTSFGGPFQVPFGYRFGPGGPFGHYMHGGHRRFSGKCGRRGRRFRHGGYQWNNNNNNNNNINNNNNNNSKDDERLKADVIENPMPTISNVVDPDQGIMKTWKLKNTGTKNLPKGLLVKYSGRTNNPMVSTEVFYIGNKNEIKPGQTFEVTICIKTPQVYGRFSSNWRLSTPDGKKFGQKLPFYLVLSPPNNDEQKNNNISNNNNGNEQKNDNNLRDSEADELAQKVVNMVDKDKNNNNNAKQDIMNIDNDNSVDMELNDSDDDNNNNTVERIDEPKEDEPKIELKEDELNIEPKKNEIKIEPKKIKPEPKSEPYKYQKEFDQIKAIGFAVNDEYLKGLLNENQGKMNIVCTLLLNNNNE